MTQTRLRLGAAGEELAAKCYTEYGWEILDRNWRCRQGELDLIVAKEVATKEKGSKKTLAFCEVKTRSSLAFGSPAEAVVKKKQERIRKLALIWLSRNHPNQSQSSAYPEIRFDVAEVMNNKVSIQCYS